jgi:hypothetical protein
VDFNLFLCWLPPLPPENHFSLLFSLFLIAKRNGKTEPATLAGWLWDGNKKLAVSNYNFDFLVCAGGKMRKANRVNGEKKERKEIAVKWLGKKFHSRGN